MIHIQGGIHGGVINLAQTHEGAVTQSGSAKTEPADVRRLLRKLERAIRESGAPADEQERFVSPVRQLEVELDQGKPLVSRLVGGWGAVEKIGAIESSWQGWERVQRIAHELAPRVHDLIQALANAAPSIGLR